MARQFFRAWSPKRVTRELVAKCVAITEEYMAAGYKLTLRQLYYQLVARDIVPNTERSYRKIGTYVTRARLAGMMDWNAIEDRARRPYRPAEWDDIGDLVDAALAGYRLPRWESQPNYAELWVEKDALASVLQPIAREYHVTLMVNRGYSSASAMKASAERFIYRGGDRPLFLFYLGDLDPSGEDMVRDIRARMVEFGVDGSSLWVDKVALTMDQVQEYNPPPNPAKITDPRADEYIAKYGRSSWEVDALTPQTLTQIIHDAFDDVIDVGEMDAVIAQEDLDKAELHRAVAELMARR